MDEEGNTALMLASAEVAELLCARGADVNLKTSRGTDFDLATEEKRQIVLQYLLSWRVTRPVTR